MSIADSAAEGPGEPAVRSVASTDDVPAPIVSETDSDFNDTTADRAEREYDEKAGLLAEGFIEPELVEQPIGEFVDDDTSKEQPA